MTGQDMHHPGEGTRFVVGLPTALDMSVSINPQKIARDVIVVGASAGALARQLRGR